LVVLILNRSLQTGVLSKTLEMLNLLPCNTPV
jgi:hypothetical protein